MEDLERFYNVLVSSVIKLQEEEFKIKVFYKNLQDYEKALNVRNIIGLEGELKWERIRYNFFEILKLMKINQNLFSDIKDNLIEKKRG
ncbi:MAG: hypothetical protein ACPLXL_01030 [Minisyncoccia bacterium]